MKTQFYKDKQYNCAGTGLVALDVLINNSNASEPTQFYAGGSCGNVLTILSYLGWEAFPIARLSNNQATALLLDDLAKWKVNDDLITVTQDGSTPIIIHRILEDKGGERKHRFEFKNPEDGSYLPSYKPCLAKRVNDIVSLFPEMDLFYFDRINRGSINLAKSYKENGGMVFFEPSNMKEIEKFDECVRLADIVKFSDDRIVDYDSVYPLGISQLEIQTLGDKGLKFRREGRADWISMPSFQIDDVADTAGAGDWLTSGIISRIFKSGKQIGELSDYELIDFLKFGQVLSAMNCTFEGARGLMYNISRTDLLLCVEHVLGLSEDKISSRSRPAKIFKPEYNSILISSLF